MGKKVNGGEKLSEENIIMEMMKERGMVKRIDIVEINKFIDERGRKEEVMVEMMERIMGRRVMERKKIRY